jgi:hypothetical protein
LRHERLLRKIVLSPAFHHRLISAAPPALEEFASSIAQQYRMELLWRAFIVSGGRNAM